jgi:hypothetical protein
LPRRSKVVAKSRGKFAANFAAQKKKEFAASLSRRGKFAAKFRRKQPIPL